MIWGDNYLLWARLEIAKSCRGEDLWVTFCNDQNWIEPIFFYRGCSLLSLNFWISFIRLLSIDLVILQFNKDTLDFTYNDHHLWIFSQILRNYDETKQIIYNSFICASFITNDQKTSLKLVLKIGIHECTFNKHKNWQYFLAHIVSYSHAAIFRDKSTNSTLIERFRNLWISWDFELQKETLFSNPTVSWLGFCVRDICHQVNR